MATHKTTGFIIRTHDFGESSRIVTLLSPEVGKLPLLAKGARRPESPLGAALDLLNQVEVVYYEGRSRGLRLLKEAALIASYPKLKRDYDRLEVALQAARALNLLLREGQRDRRIYHLFEELLEELEGSELKLELELEPEPDSPSSGPIDERPPAPAPSTSSSMSPRYLAFGFKLKLIDLLGFGPILDRCSLCREPLEEARRQGQGQGPGVGFSPEGGGVVCPACLREGKVKAISVESPLIKALQMILRLPLGKLDRLVLPEELLAQGEELLERFIAYHLQPIQF